MDRSLLFLWVKDVLQFLMKMETFYFTQTAVRFGMIQIQPCKMETRYGQFFSETPRKRGFGAGTL